MEEIARQPAIRIMWNGKNVTEELSRFNASLTYTDKEEEASDDISLSMDNGEALWSEDWYPQEGDTVEVFFGYADKLVNGGLFQVDELTLSGPPNMIDIKGLASFITKALQTRNNKAFEAQTLRQIAQFFCTKHGLKLIDESGSMLSQIYLERKTQEDKTDLQFLAEIAKEYGFIFSVKGDKLVFTSYYALDNAEAIKDIDITQVGSYSLTEKTYDTYASGSITKRVSRKNVIVGYAESDEAGGGSNTQVGGGHAENKVQAELKVKSGLWSKNRFKQSGTINEIPGDPELVAGVNFNLTGIGAASGKYHIVKSTHVLSGSGAYTTALEVRKTGTIPKPQRVPKPAETKTATYAENEYEGEVE